MASLVEEGEGAVLSSSHNDTWRARRDDRGRQTFQDHGARPDLSLAVPCDIASAHTNGRVYVLYIDAEVEIGESDRLASFSPLGPRRLAI